MTSKAKYRIGIDIGSNAIKLVSYHLKKKSELSRLALIDLVKEERVQHPDEVDETHLMSVVHELLQELPYKKASIRICLTATMNNVFIIPMPQIAEHELKQALFWELGPLLPEPVKNYEYDYRIFRQDNKKKRIVVLVGVYLRERLERILKVFSGLGKDVDILETDALSALDLYLTTAGEIEESIGFLQLGAAHSQYTILIPGHNPGFLFIPFGGNTLNELIAKQKGISFLTAESLRRNEDGEVSVKSSQKSAIYKNPGFRDTLQRFANTIIRFNIHHQKKTGQTVNKIVVTGGLLNDHFIARTLQQDSNFFQVPCEFWDPVRNFFPKELFEPHQAYHFASALSLALR